MVDVLVSLLIVLVIAAVVYWIVGLLPFPQPIKNIVLAVLGIFLLIFIISMFFGSGGFVHTNWRLRH